MNNKGIGAIFCLIAAILESSRYIAAAIFMSNVTSWDRAIFQEGLKYTGSFLNVAAVIMFITGIGFLGYGIYKEIRNGNR